MARNDDKGPDREIKFTIDSREFTITEASQTAAALLSLAGLDANGYELGELHGNNPEPKKYADDDKVQVQNGDRFVSIRQSAPVA